MITKLMMAAVLATLSGAASAVLPPPAPAQVQSQAAKKAAADAKAEQDKLLLLAKMDALSNAWRGKAGANGWTLNPQTTLPAAAAASGAVAGAVAALSAPATQTAPSGQPAGVMTTTGANAPITSEKSGTAAPSADVKPAPSPAPATVKTR